MSKLPATGAATPTPGYDCSKVVFGPFILPGYRFAPRLADSFIGFRICEAYYAQARDKPAALRHLVALDNASELLAAGRRYLAAR